MTRKELEQIKLTKKWPFKFSDIYNHYFFIIFPLGITFVGVFTTLSAFESDLLDYKITSVVILMIGILLTFFIINRLYQNQTFYEYEIHGLSIAKIDTILKNTKFNHPKFYKTGYFQATTNVSGFSWGETITIIPDNEKLLINSRPNSQPITIFKDKKNISRFIEDLKNHY